jgi:2-polyprenyl-3-methyl-5-hydroxy-6-metoxy-1,4-benzoquinol methylase
MTDTSIDKIYDGYEEWKGWSDLFCYSDDERDYYHGETRALAIRGARVLEIGFGSGSFLQWAADNGASVSGTEVNRALASAARDRGFDVLNADIGQVADGYTDHFDTIVAFDVFEHLSIPQIKSYLAATEKMLKPGGHLLLRFPNGQSPFGLVAQHGDYTHRTALSFSIFDQLIKHLRYMLVCYRQVYNVRGRNWATTFARFWQSMAKRAISRTLNMIFANRIIYDPVVVLILKKHPL